MQMKFFLQCRCLDAVSVRATSLRLLSTYTVLSNSYNYCAQFWMESNFHPSNRCFQFVFDFAVIFVTHLKRRADAESPLSSVEAGPYTIKKRKARHARKLAGFLLLYCCAGGVAGGVAGAGSVAGGVAGAGVVGAGVVGAGVAGAGSVAGGVAGAVDVAGGVVVSPAGGAPVRGQ
jgi:hypothetical protein